MVLPRPTSSASSRRVAPCDAGDCRLELVVEEVDGGAGGAAEAVVARGGATERAEAGHPSPSPDASNPRPRNHGSRPVERQQQRPADADVRDGGSHQPARRAAVVFDRLDHAPPVATDVDQRTASERWRFLKHQRPALRQFLQCRPGPACRRRLQAGAYGRKRAVFGTTSCRPSAATLTIYARRVAGGSRAGTAGSGSAKNGEATRDRQDGVTDLMGPGTDPGTMAGRRSDREAVPRPAERRIPSIAYFTGDTERAGIEFGSRAGFGGGALTSPGPSFSIATCSFNVASGAT